MSLKVGLIDVDGHNFPNLAQMKLSAYYKARGCLVEVASPRGEYDVVYMSKVFDNTYSPDLAWEPHADDIIRGGTGYGLDNKLSYEVEHTYPDYELYPGLTENTAFGFLTRGCPRGCSFCIVSEKEGRVAVKVADLDEFWRGQKFVKLLDANILACKDAPELLGQLAESKAYIDFTQGLDIRLMCDDYIQLINRMKLKSIHFAWDDPRHDLTENFRGYAAKAKHKLHGDWGSVYVLCNYNTTHDEDVWRIDTLISLGYSPYVMIYNKPYAPKITRHLQRWCNAPPLRKSCSFAEYLKTKRHIGEEKTMTEEQYIEVREINRKLMIAVDIINKLQVNAKNLNISGYEDEILDFFKKQKEKYETKMEEYVCAPGSRWIYDDDESIVCERCRHSCPMDADGMCLTDSRYCPHCGAKME